MAKKTIPVLGAGLAGLSAAWHMEKDGVDCQVFEAEPEIGGLCRSKKIKGFTFDYDGHLLHFNNEYTHNFVKDVLGVKLTRHKRNSFIRYVDCDIPYPFQANFSKLPEKIREECFQGLKEVRDNHKNSYPDFKAWAYASFGKGITEHFMLPYNEKFWTVPATELTTEWLDGFVPVLKLDEIINGSAKDLESIGYNNYFYYPAKGGIQELVSALEGNMVNKPRLNSKITQIDTKNNKIIVNQKENISYDKLISTIPLPELKNIIKDIPRETERLLNLLNYNSILVFNIGIKSEINNNKHWIYFPEKKNRYFRIGFYSSFSLDSAPLGHSSVYVEVSYPKDTKIDKIKLKDEILKDLAKTGLISSTDMIVYCDIIDIKYGYPIYDHNYKNAVSEILNFLAQYNIYSIGRYGLWRYFSMEDAILDGRKAACLVSSKK